MLKNYNRGSTVMPEIVGASSESSYIEGCPRLYSDDFQQMNSNNHTEGVMESSEDRYIKEPIESKESEREMSISQLRTSREIKKPPSKRQGIVGWGLMKAFGIKGNKR
jgi:hypothetical protein